MTATRLIRTGDAAELAELLRENRAFLAPFEPLRSDDQFTLAGVKQAIRFLLAGYGGGSVLPFVILDEGRMAGRITLSNIVRGPFLSASLGYWVAQPLNGRGHATAAVGEVCELAFGPQGLHRIEAGTLTDNLASQRVLTRNGFERYGLAPRYLNIAGRWQDHVLYQRLSPREA